MPIAQGIGITRLCCSNEFEREDLNLQPQDPAIRLSRCKLYNLDRRGCIAGRIELAAIVSVTLKLTVDTLELQREDTD